MRLNRDSRNGLLIYGEWAGNPKGNLENVSRCIEGVYGAGSYIEHQCTRKRGHGPEGKYCKQHTPREEAGS